MGNSGSSSFAGKALKVGALVAAAGAAAWALGVFSDPEDDRTPKHYPPPPDDHQRPPHDAHGPTSERKWEEYVVFQAGPAEPTPPDPHRPGEIKLMCYNIWCVEVKLHERMKAIGKLIQKHSPDIILLQEVTPSIYKIFQDCNWWGSYKCSVPPEKATRKFFCMLLSKLPVKKSICIHFKSSSEGKGLSVAWINAGEKKLVVATCHLKRPTDSGTNSTERVAQAKEALSFLHSARNVVLGGDMNWDEDSDGHFPLPGEWYDAWSILRPREDGWTYDTKSNSMLMRNRLVVQKRLDRFLCKLKDFEIVSIDMIGTDAIHQIRFSIKSNSRKKPPVLPSDHYGLILTLCLK
ncbi:Uncharacterized protein M6B38_231085 [Iris pallida]|uniref:Endonuclease/exonuclease/phosphatase domain-containing protein n=1 Tax=Iris pallida TaxID=29817 RepID=A0AAX6DQX7_IRIPA|nr:Uncharacterized protein M6B38_231085 [Iris pallida]